MFKRFGVITLTAVILVATPAYGGQWMEDSVGWWWQNDDGSYPAWYWAWIDGNHDGVAENYYFDGNGYLSYDTADQGIQVDANGAMIYNGAVCTAVLPEGVDFFAGMAIDGQRFNITADARGAADFEREKEEWKQAAAVKEVNTVADIDPYELAALILELVNEERVKNGREPLTVNEELMDIAFMRAEEADEFFSHTRPDGSKAETSVPFSDYVGENLASPAIAAYIARDSEGFAEYTVNGWMNSSGHRRNILNSRYQETGVGVYIGNEYVTISQLYID